MKSILYTIKIHTVEKLTEISKKYILIVDLGTNVSLS